MENEALFRGLNEQVQKSIEEVNAVADEEEDDTIRYDSSMDLHFFCECSDENCRKRIKMTINEYVAIHKDRKAFIVIPGHEFTPIEEVVDRKPDYNVVIKKKNVPKQPTGLNPTPLNNT